MYSVALIIFVVSEKGFEHFPIGSNVNLLPAVVAILDFRSALWENVQVPSSQKLQIRLKPDRNVHWMVLYKV
jgi:hypothetical protein